MLSISSLSPGKLTIVIGTNLLLWLFVSCQLSVVLSGQSARTRRGRRATLLLRAAEIPSRSLWEVRIALLFGK